MHTIEKVERILVVVVTVVVGGALMSTLDPLAMFVGGTILGTGIWVGVSK